MITFYEAKDVVAFGKYLLSDERKQSLNVPEGLTLEDVAKEVYHADMENWKAGNEISFVTRNE